MYVKPQNYRYPAGVRLPENYGGSTFREEPPQADTRDGEQASAVNTTEEKASDTEAAPASLLSPSFRLRLGSLFDNKKIGTEELLIIGLILLLADSDSNDDLILFLILLFFIK